MAFKKNNPGCQCCGEPPCSCVDVTTTDCDPDVTQWFFSTSGITNDNCSDCTTWNGDWELCYAGSDTWNGSKSNDTPCSHSAGDPLWQLIRNGANYELRALGTGYFWKLATGSWSCKDTNTLTLNTPTPVPAPCGNLPATIDLTPCLFGDDGDTTCGGICNAGTVPSSVQIDISGLVDYFCDCDAYVDGTYVLDSTAGACIFWHQEQLTSLTCTAFLCTKHRIDLVAKLVATGWLLDVTMTLWEGTRYCFSVTFRYGYTASTPFDCSVARSMTHISGFDTFWCQDWNSATVTLTPL